MTIATNTNNLIYSFGINIQVHKKAPHSKAHNMINFEKLWLIRLDIGVCLKQDANNNTVKPLNLIVLIVVVSYQVVYYNNHMNSM